MLDDGRIIVVKSGDASDANRFQAERAGLAALAVTKTVLVPQPLACVAQDGRAWLMLEFLASGAGSAEAWNRFGAELAALHRFDVGPHYGFEADNYLGSTPQINDWHEDWVEFNRACRFDPQIARADAGGLLGPSERSELQRLLDRLDQIIPSDPFPALLHGDLWSGNALACGSGRIAVIDPACSIGDGWADIAMMRLFGGFPDACFKAYAEAVGQRIDSDINRRITLYQLYHVLNHLNIFGRGYAGQMRALVADLLR